MNNIGIFDTHAHYDDERFDGDRDEFLSSLPSFSVSNVINCGCDYYSCLKSIELCNKYYYFHCALGIHPSNINENSESELINIKELYDFEKCVAVGEIGLEYHYDEVPKETQLYFFEKQLELANKLKLPVIVHDRDAHEDTMRLLNKYKPTGVVHCFSGSVEMAKEVVKLGMYIGLGGALTFKNARKPCEVADYVPIERILLETDCPYMSPVPHRGERNSSDKIIHIAEKIAEIKGIDINEVITQTNINAHRLFNIKD